MRQPRRGGVISSEGGRLPEVRPNVEEMAFFQEDWQIHMSGLQTNIVAVAMVLFGIVPVSHGGSEEVPVLSLPSPQVVTKTAQSPQQGMPAALARVFVAVAASDTPEIVQALQDGGDPNGLGFRVRDGLQLTPLGIAVLTGSIASMEVLLDAGARVNSEASAVPPLWAASFQCKPAATSILIGRGANVNTRRGRSGLTPLLIACQSHCSSVARLLLESGADPHAATVDGVTPLMAAAWWGSVPVMRLLLAHDPDLLATDHAGHDGVYFASLRGHAECLRLLLDASADADRANVEGWTALRAAARSGSISCVELLLDHGAEPDTTGRDGRTPLQAAAAHCHVDVMKKLMEAGATLGVSRGDWPTLDDAVRSGCPAAIRILLESEAGTHAAANHLDRAASDIQREIHQVEHAPAMVARLVECKAIIAEARGRLDGGH
jgi:ankyrin repeat protein